MTFRKLFASAGAAALLAGTANAAITTGLGEFGVNGIEAPACLATEGSVLTNNTNSIEAEITLGAAADLAVGTYKLIATVTGGTFNVALSPSNATITTAGSTIAVAGGTGASGQNAVTFDITTTAANAANDTINLNIPFVISGSNDVVLSLSLLSASNSELLAKAERTIQVLRATDAASVTVFSDAYAADSTINAATPSKFTTSATDTATSARLGIAKITYAGSSLNNITCVIPDASAGGGGNVYASVSAVGGSDDIAKDQVTIQLTASSDGSLPTATSTVGSVTLGKQFTLAGGAGVDGTATSASATVGQDPGTAAGNLVNTEVFPITLAIPATNTVAIEEQTVSVSYAMNYTPTGLQDDAAVSAALDKLQTSGAETGTYQWVGDATKGRVNVFRCTGTGVSSTAGVQATMSGSRAGLDGATELLAGVAPVEGQIVFNSNDLGAAFGDFDIADFKFNFIGASSVDCDRLMSSPANGIVTTYNGSN